MAENTKIEEAYALEIAPMLGRNQWVHPVVVFMDTMEGLAKIPHIKVLMMYPLARRKNAKDHEFLLV